MARLKGHFSKYHGDTSAIDKMLFLVKNLKETEGKRNQPNFKYLEKIQKDNSQIELRPIKSVNSLPYCIIYKKNIYIYICLTQQFWIR